MLLLYFNLCNTPTGRCHTCSPLFWKSCPEICHRVLGILTVVELHDDLRSRKQQLFLEVISELLSNRERESSSFSVWHLKAVTADPLCHRCSLQLCHCHGSSFVLLLLVNRQHVKKGTAAHTADSVQPSNMPDRNQAAAQTQTFHTSKGGKRPHVKICEMQRLNCLKEWKTIRLVSLLFSVWHPSFLYKWFSLVFFVVASEQNSAAPF